MTRTVRAGFSLVEVLVIVAIVAVLAAILFPLFARSQEKGRSTTCLANMRQIGTAVLLYAQDSDNQMPLNASDVKDFANTKGEEWHPNWLSGITPYTRNTALFRCPEAVPAQDDAALPNAAPGITPTAVSDSSVQGNGVVMQRRLTDIPAPDRIVFLGEERIRVSRALLRPRLGSGDSYNSWHGLDDVTHEERYNNNHNGGGNLLFCDGHSTWRKLDTQRSGDFGLVPDQPWTKTNGIKPDGGGVYRAAF
jgi:prepilin-type processing-associated H-X9-DG protein/prepilin-type N-terminal cleavage/methylation domain-containing protein